MIKVFKKRNPAPERRQASKDNQAGFEDLCGVWTDEEAEEFLNSITYLETVESEEDLPDPCG